jgi:hypothetical protein
MGSPAESFEKKNIFFKNSDEIRRLDGTRPMKVVLRYFKKVFGPIHLSKRYILKSKER